VLHQFYWLFTFHSGTILMIESGKKNYIHGTLHSALVRF